MEANQTVVDDSETLARRCVAICEERKAESVVLCDVRRSSVLADFYVICSGNSEPHVRAIGAHLSKDLSKEGIKAHHIEGKPASMWMLLDFGVVVVHIMGPELRAYYRIEELWNTEDIVYSSVGPQPEAVPPAPRPRPRRVDRAGKPVVAPEPEAEAGD